MKFLHILVIAACTATSLAAQKTRQPTLNCYADIGPE